MTVSTAELRPLLKRLKLGPMLDTLPERIALARRDGLDWERYSDLAPYDARRRQGACRPRRCRRAGVPAFVERGRVPRSPRISSSGRGSRGTSFSGGAVDPGLCHLAEVLVGGHDADGERLGEEALPDADRPHEQDVTCSRRSRNCSEQAASRSRRSRRTCADQSKSSSRQSCSKPAWRWRSSRRPWSPRLTSSARAICRKSA